MNKNPLYPFATLVTVLMMLAAACSLPGLPAGDEPASAPTKPVSAEIVPTLPVSEPPVQQPTGTPQFPFETGEIYPAAFAGYPGLQVRLPAEFSGGYSLPVDLNQVQISETITLSPEQRQLLSQNGFVVAAPSGKYQEFYQVYESVRYEYDVPVFATTDSVFHIYHLIFDKLLRDLERQYFIPDLEMLTTALFQASLEQLLGFKRRAPRQQFVEQHSERVDVAAGVHVHAAQADLLGAGISRRADELLELGEQRLVGKARTDGLGDAKINYFRRGHPIHFGHQHVGRFDIPVDDAFVMGVLDGAADLNKEPQPLGGGQLVLIAVVGDPHPAHQFHDEVGSAGVSSARVQDLSDVGMVHEGQGLALGFKPGDDLPGVHAQLDHLERHTPPDRFLLLGHIDHPAATFADLLQQFIAANPVAYLFC